MESKFYRTRQGKLLCWAQQQQQQLTNGISDKMCARSLRIVEIKQFLLVREKNHLNLVGSKFVV